MIHSAVNNLSILHPVRTVLLVSVMLVCSACANLNPLNWFSGDEEVNVPKELVDFPREVNLERDWSRSVGNGQGDNYTRIEPAFDGGVIYAASENGVVTAVTAESGDEVWRTRVSGTISGGVGAGNGLVLVGTQEAEMIALDQFDGSERWRVLVTSEVLAAPQTDGDVVVAQTVDDKLIALDAADGSRRWIYEATIPALTLRGTSKPLITPTGAVIAGFSNGTLVSVSANNGIWRWEERVAVPEGQYDIDRVIDVDGDLMLDGDRVFASSYQGNLMAFDVASGRIVWGFEASSYNGLTQGFGNLYVSDDEGHIIAIRNNTEEVVWRNTDLEFRQLTAPVSIGNYIAVADFEGYIHLLSQVDGRIVGRVRIDNNGIRSSLVARNGRLFAYGNSGRLEAFSLQQVSR